MKSGNQSLVELRERAFEVFAHELGVADTARFLNQFSTGQEAYTRNREHMLEGLSLDDGLGAIKGRRKRSAIIHLT